jgi:hypothetical protein
MSRRRIVIKEEKLMSCRSRRILLTHAILATCILLSVHAPLVSQTAQKLGPVGEQESKPSSAARPVNSVVDPGVIPSRQAITPAGLQSVFESRVFGVAFGENGESIYAAVLGQKGTNV